MNMEAKEVIEQILETALQVSSEKDRLKAIFEKSGISISDDMKVSGINGDSIAVMATLMSNLAEMAVVKISAKQIIRKGGITL